MDPATLTLSDNPNIKGISFVDSTKVSSPDKVLYHDRWYAMEGDDFYRQMNDSQMPIKVSGSFGDAKKVYHSEADGWRFNWKDGASSADSGDIQRIIDIIRYNENFYFEDINNRSGTTAIGGFGGDIKSIVEFQLVGDALIKKQFGASSGAAAIVPFIGTVSNIQSELNKKEIGDLLHLVSP